MQPPAPVRARQKPGAYYIICGKCFHTGKRFTASPAVRSPGSINQLGTNELSAILERSFRVLEALAKHREGKALSSLSAELDMPLSATHRLLAELVRCGYVRQDGPQGNYTLTIKLVSLGLIFLGASGIVDVAQPLLDELAAASGELVRLAVVIDDDLTFVAKAQGAKSGLRYDPDMGRLPMLSCSAAGYAWLSTMSEEEARERVARQGFGKPGDYGPNAPTTLKAVMAHVRAARRRGFSMIDEVFTPGMTAMAAPLLGEERKVLGVITVAGPSVRLTEERMLGYGPELLRTAREVVSLSGASTMFKRRA